MPPRRARAKSTRSQKMTSRMRSRRWPLASSSITIWVMGFLCVLASSMVPFRSRPCSGSARFLMRWQTSSRGSQPPLRRQLELPFNSTPPQAALLPPSPVLAMPVSREPSF